MYDYNIIIIGAGVTGCSIARELSKYDVSICVLEKGEDVASGTSKANSGVIHSGFNSKPGTLMAEMVVKGNERIWKLAKDLEFPVKRNGALIVCTNPDERGKLDVLLEQAHQNGVPGVEILERETVLKMEPNLSDETVAALYAPTGGVLYPPEMAIAMGENAVANGVDFKFETKVKTIKKDDAGRYILETNHGPLVAKAVVNAAGVYADYFHNLFANEDNKIHITARKGEYLLFDKVCGDVFSASVFPLPGKMGKGILTAPTLEGNLYVGPTATDIEDKEGVDTTQEILDQLVEKVKNNPLCKVQLPLNKIIRSFSGLRAHEDHHEFIVEEMKESPFFFDASGIESPGLTSSPAIGVRLAKIMEKSMHLKRKEHFISKRKGITHFAELSRAEQKALIEKDPSYGRIVCRCETVTEGEVIEVIHRPIGARSLDMVKRRTRAGAGRCQSGFCMPRVLEILSRELDMPMTAITKKGCGSEVLVGKNKESIKDGDEK